MRATYEVGVKKVNVAFLLGSLESSKRLSKNKHRGNECVPLGAGKAVYGAMTIARSAMRVYKP